MVEYLEIKNITKKYPKTIGIDDITFSCLEGSFTVILGPSGAGKTTTLNIIAGILQETSGDVLINGESIRKIPPQQRQISMVFEDYALYPTFSVYENIASPLRVRNFSKDEIDKKVKAIATMLGIDLHLEKLPSKVSGGQKQRTALARCLVRDADIYLLDEPIGHLDAKLRHRMRGEFKRIHKELGKTMIYVCHDYREALSLADNVIILNDGKIVQSGSPERVFSDPCNTFVARLLGEPPMNLIDYEFGSVRDGVLSLQFENKVSKIKGVPFKDLSLGKVKLGFRYFSASLHDSPGKNRIEGSIFVWEPIEDSKTYTVSIGDNLIKVVTSRESHFDLNQKVFLALDSTALYLFDGETGERIDEKE